MSLYQLKPQFQNSLRPLTRWLYRLGVTANQVTVSACVVSLVLGVGLYCSGQVSWGFALIPLWLFLRMAFNAIDGMLAREHGQKSTLGAYLNELTDVVSDAALYLPFVLVDVFSPLQMALVVWLSALSEMAGVLPQSQGLQRQYVGPMGKSDRALVFAVLGAWVAYAHHLPSVMTWLMWGIIGLITATIVRRLYRGLQTHD